MARGLCGEEWCEIFATGHAGGWIELVHLVGGTGDAATVQACGCDTGDDVGEGADAIHEDPEAGKGLGRLEDTVSLKPLAEFSCDSFMWSMARERKRCVPSKGEYMGHSPIEYHSHCKQECCDCSGCLGIG